MNRLFIDKDTAIEVKNSVLHVDGAKIPIASIDMLYLHASAHITLKDLAAIARKGATIVAITSRPRDFIHIQKRHFKNADLKIAQYRALDISLDIAKYLLIKKSLAQVQTLRALRLTPHTPDLDAIRRASSIQELLGLEGTLAKEYFSRYFSIYPRILAKGERTKHPPLDPINALLSYLYTILYYEIGSRLVYYGFEPTISYLHTPFRDHLSLASDLLEPLRSDTDLFVAKLYERGLILPSMFEKRAGVYLKPTARRELWSEIKPFLEKTDPKIKREIAMLREIVKNGSSSRHLRAWLSKGTTSRSQSPTRSSQ